MPAHAGSFKAKMSLETALVQRKVMHAHAVLNIRKAITWVSWARKVIHGLKGCWVCQSTNDCSPLFYLQKTAVKEQDNTSAEAVESLLSSNWQEAAVLSLVRLMMQSAERSIQLKCEAGSVNLHLHS